MRVLLDHCVPGAFGELLTGHEAEPAGRRGWARLRNGLLLRAAADAGFDALVTFDASLIKQQNRAALPVAVILIRCRSNKLEVLAPDAPEVLSAMRALRPGTWVEVGRFRMRRRRPP